MKPTTVLRTALFTTLFAMAACSKNDSNNSGGGNNNPGGGGTTPGPLFTAVKSMIQSNCATAGCHSATAPAGGVNFTADNTIVAQKDRIKVRAVDQAGTANQMPPPPRAPLSAADQKRITDWVSAGGRLTD